MKILKNSICALAFLLCMQESRAVGFQIDDSTVCLGSSVTVTDTSVVPLGKSVLQWAWYFGNGDSAIITQGTSTYTYANRGTYALKMKITYSDLSLDSFELDSVHVFKNPTALFSVSKTLVCYGATVTFTQSASAGDGVLTTYVLDYGDGSAPLNPFYTTASKSYATVGSFSPTFTVTDANNCSNSFSMNIQTVSPPAISFITDNFTCKDTVVRLVNTTPNKTSVNYQWNWQFISDLGAVQYQSTNWDASYAWNSGGYKRVDLFLTDTSTLCTTTLSQLIKVDSIPPIIISPSTDTAICQGSSVALSVKTASDTAWWRENTWLNKVSDTGVVLTPQNSYTYRFYSKNVNCPYTYKDINITVVPTITGTVVATPASIVVGSKSDIKLTVAGIWDSVRWTPTSNISCISCDSFSVSPQRTTVYSGTVYYSVKKKVCSFTDTVTVHVDSACDKSKIRIPNAFTPNGDLLNNEFYPRGYALVEIDEFKVYNRWGNLVYSASSFPPNEQKFGWNGKLNNSGDDLPPDLYIYTIVAKCSNNAILNFQGEINLIR